TAGLCQAAWRTGRIWRWVVIGVFVFLAANADPRNELLICVGLVCWALLCLLENGSRLLCYAVIWVALAVFAALAKVTLLLPATLSLGAIACDLAIRGKLKPCAALASGFSFTFLLAWMALGQDMRNLGLFFANATRIAAGYDQTMWIEPFPILVWPGII